MKNVSAWNMKYFSLEGKTAMVTGGNKGLGIGYSTALFKAGANVFIPSIVESNPFSDILDDYSGRIVIDKGDLTDPQFRQQTVEKCIHTFGSIDILVNNAGMIIRNNVKNSTLDEWNKVISLNLTSVYDMSSIVAKVMVTQGGGKIINIASLLSYRGGIFSPSYPASKHGVVGLTKVFANQFAADGIQVNAIAPGYIGYGNSLDIMGDEDVNDQLISRVPAGHWGGVSDLMGAVVFLASKASSYVNGIVLPVDGGWLGM